MTRIRITGSRVHRVWKCPASAVLPQVDQGDLHESARAEGKIVHAFLERCSTIAPEDAIWEFPEAMHPLLRSIDVGDLPTKLSAEVAFAYNAVTGAVRVLGQGMDRQYHMADPPPGPDEICATFDSIGIAEGAAGRRGYCGDYKKGHAKYPAPDMFGQTLLGALCVMRHFRCDDCVVELTTIHDDGGHHQSRRIVDEWDLDTFDRELRAAWQLVDHWDREYARTGHVEAHEGTWCRYCEAYKSCPAKVALVRSIPRELIALGVHKTESGELDVRRGAISVRNAADAYMAIERIQDVLKRARKEIDGIAWNEDIPLPDGRVLGRHKEQDRKLVGQVAAEVLERRYGRETRDRAVKISMTLAAVHDAVQANIKPGEKITKKDHTGVLDRVMAEIDAAGGVKISESESVRARVPKRKPT